jgi:hypothetical protein
MELNSASFFLTAIIQELSWSTVLPFLISIFSVAVIVKHRKTANLAQWRSSTSSDSKKTHVAFSGLTAKKPIGYCGLSVNSI